MSLNSIIPGEEATKTRPLRNIFSVISSRKQVSPAPDSIDFLAATADDKQPDQHSEGQFSRPEPLFKAPSLSPDTLDENDAAEEAVELTVSTNPIAASSPSLEDEFDELERLAGGAINARQPRSPSPILSHPDPTFADRLVAKRDVQRKAPDEGQMAAAVVSPASSSSQGKPTQAAVDIPTALQALTAAQEKLVADRQAMRHELLARDKEISRLVHELTRRESTINGLHDQIDDLRKNLKTRDDALYKLESQAATAEEFKVKAQVVIGKARAETERSKADCERYKELYEKERNSNATALSSITALIHKAESL